MKDIILSPITLNELQIVISEVVRTELKSELQTLVYKKPDELITRKEAAEILGISLPTLHEWTISGKIPAYRISSRIRYKRGEIEQSLNKIRTWNK